MPEILGFIIYDFNNIPVKFQSHIWNILIKKKKKWYLFDGVGTRAGYS